MKKNVVSFFAAVFIFISCNDRLKNRNQEEKIIFKPESKPKISEDSSKFKVERFYVGDATEPKRLFIKKIVYQKKTLFVYKYEFSDRIDSLEFFKDSVKMNGILMNVVAKKSIKYKGRIIEVKKCYYDSKKISYQANFFVNDSLGVIFAQYVAYSRSFWKYSPDNYDELYPQIYNDSAFVDFYSKY